MTGRKVKHRLQVKVGGKTVCSALNVNKYDTNLQRSACFLLLQSIRELLCVEFKKKKTDLPSEIGKITD